uniref:Uncharacterized protein n=1 Tax=Arundo donax TaxID=35708 RepID=A0A0A9GB23_ARUDO
MSFDLGKSLFYSPELFALST